MARVRGPSRLSAAKASGAPTSLRVWLCLGCAQMQTGRVGNRVSLGQSNASDLFVSALLSRVFVSSACRHGARICLAANIQIDPTVVRVRVLCSSAARFVFAQTNEPGDGGHSSGPDERRWQIIKRVSLGIHFIGL